jgi:hypothetical protein
VDHDSLLVHLLSLLALASMSFICGYSAIVAAHYLYMYESMMRDLQIKNPKTWDLFMTSTYICLSGCEISVGFDLHGNLNCSKLDHILLC